MPFFKDRQYQEFNKLILSENNQGLITLMNQWPTPYLALCQNNDHYKKALRHPDFTEFWRKRCEGLRTSELPDFRFVKQDSLSDADFVTGYLFYVLALKEKEKNKTERYRACLELAVNYGSYHALKCMVYDWIMQPMEDKAAYCNDLAAHLVGLEDVIHGFKSPGYLLLALGYMNLAAAASSQEEIPRKNMSYQYFWKYLNLAQLAEKDSCNEIHNAYFGKGLAFSNPWSLDSFEKILQSSSGLLRGSVDKATQKFIKHQANQEYKDHCEANDELKSNHTVRRQ